MKKIFTLIATVLMAVSLNAQTWDFNVGKVEGFAASYASDKAALDKAVTNGTWALVSGTDGRYQTAYKVANEQLAAGETVLEITKGLYVTGASGKFRIDVANNQFGFNGKDLAMRIKGLKKGQTVQFLSRSASNSALDRYFEATANLTVVAGFDVPEEGNPVKTNTATVTDDGDVVFTTMVGGLNVTAISVIDVDGTTVLTKDQVIEQGENYVAPREMTGSIVLESKTWIAPQDAEKDQELSGADENGVFDMDGLYLRGKTGSHSVKAAVENVETTIAGEDISVARTFYTPSNGNFAPAADASADDAIKNATDMSLALNIGAAGKLYVYLRARNISTEGRYVRIYKNGETVLEKLGTDWTTRTYTVTNSEGTEEQKTEAAYELHEFDVDAAGATFFIGGNAGGVQVAVVKFVATNSGETTIAGPFIQADDAAGVWYNLRGQAIETPTKGIFIKNGKKYIFK